MQINAKQLNYDLWLIKKLKKIFAIKYINEQTFIKEIFINETLAIKKNLTG